MELCDVTIIESRTVQFRMDKADPYMYHDDGTLVTYWDVDRKPHIFVKANVTETSIPVPQKRTIG